VVTKELFNFLKICYPYNCLGLLIAVCKFIVGAKLRSTYIWYYKKKMFTERNVRITSLNTLLLLLYLQKQFISYHSYFYKHILHANTVESFSNIIYYRLNIYGRTRISSNNFFFKSYPNFQLLPDFKKIIHLNCIILLSLVPSCLESSPIPIINFLFKTQTIFLFF